jgi:hypothetical protein
VPLPLERGTDELKLAYTDFIEEWGAGKVYAAFTVAELGHILPDEVGGYKTHDEGINWCCIKYVLGEHSKYTHLE